MTPEARKVRAADPLLYYGILFGLYLPGCAVLLGLVALRALWGKR
jgi:hypothetical protein